MAGMPGRFDCVVGRRSGAPEAFCCREGRRPLEVYQGAESSVNNFLAVFPPLRPARRASLHPRGRWIPARKDSPLNPSLPKLLHKKRGGGKSRRPVSQAVWSGRGESNPFQWLGKPSLNRSTTPA